MSTFVAYKRINGDMNDIKLMNRAADNIRILAASMVEKAKSGHPGGAMGGADFVNVLFSEFLIYDPENPLWEGRDRFFLDPGHMSPMLYSVLALAGKFSIEELMQFRQWGSVTPGHPEVNFERGVETLPVRWDKVTLMLWELLLLLSSFRLVGAKR